VTSSAPRTDSRILAAVERLHERDIPIAEINRRVGAVAEIIGLTRPSYEQVRRLVRRLRDHRRLDPGVGSVLLDIAFRAAPPEALLDVLFENRGSSRRK
jgi:hypothetical protein